MQAKTLYTAMEVERSTEEVYVWVHVEAEAYFRILPNIYDEMFWGKYLTALFSQKLCPYFIDLGQGSTYVSDMSSAK